MCKSAARRCKGHSPCHAECPQTRRTPVSSSNKAEAAFVQARLLGIAPLSISFFSSSLFAFLLEIRVLVSGLASDKLSASLQLLLFGRPCCSFKPSSQRKGVPGGSGSEACLPCKPVHVLCTGSPGGSCHSCRAATSWSAPEGGAPSALRVGRTFPVTGLTLLSCTCLKAATKPAAMEWQV
jgi:hypothetical protein